MSINKKEEIAVEPYLLTLLDNPKSKYKEILKKMRSDIEQRIVGIIDEKWAEIKKEHDGFCHCGMQSHCEMFGIGSIKEILDGLKNELKDK